MPIINKTPLRKIHDVTRALDYLGNGYHENHRNHTVETPRYYGGSTTNKADFLAELSRAITFLNGERSPSNQLRISATWWTLAFPMQSHLMNYERASYEAAMLAAIGCAEFAAISWHTNICNGSADLNIIDPGIDLDVIPSLRRSNKTNLLMRIRAKSDRWLLAANTSRADEGEQTIETVEEAQTAMTRKAPRVELLQLLGDSCSRHSLVPSAKTLPKMLGRSGFTSDDWEIDLNNQLLVWRFPGKSKRSKKRPIARIKMDNLIREIIEVVGDHGISLEINDIPDRNTKASSPDQENNVLHPLRTTPDVIQDTKEQKNEEISI